MTSALTNQQRVIAFANSKQQFAEQLIWWRHTLVRPSGLYVHSCTDVRFASFFSSGVITAIVVNFTGKESGKTHLCELVWLVLRCRWVGQLFEMDWNTPHRPVSCEKLRGSCISPFLWYRFAIRTKSHTCALQEPVQQELGIKRMFLFISKSKFRPISIHFDQLF